MVMGLYPIIEKLGLLFLGAAIGHFLTKDREKSKDRRDAKREFREAFDNRVNSDGIKLRYVLCHRLCEGENK